MKLLKLIPDYFASKFHNTSDNLLREVSITQNISNALKQDGCEFLNFKLIFPKAEANYRSIAKRYNSVNNSFWLSFAYNLRRAAFESHWIRLRFEDLRLKNENSLDTSDTIMLTALYNTGIFEILRYTDSILVKLKYHNLDKVNLTTLGFPTIIMENCPKKNMLDRKRIREIHDKFEGILFRQLQKYGAN